MYVSAIGSQILVGALAGIQSLGVSGESFGGIDVIHMDFMAESMSVVTPPLLSSPIDLETRIWFRLMSVGRVGIAGSKESISGSSGYGFYLDGIQRGRGSTLRYGGGLKIESNNYQSSAGAANYSNLAIRFIMRSVF